MNAPLPDWLSKWKLEQRGYGMGQYGWGSNLVLSYGKWSVVGSTGYFRIVHPTGWREDKPVFETEIEAMQWVMKKGKAKQ